MTKQGLANSSARLFSNPAGDYGSMVNERIGNSQWEDGSELGDTWASRNAFSYGRQVNLAVLCCAGLGCAVLCCAVLCCAVLN